MALSKFRGVRVRYEILRRFVVEDLRLDRTSEPSSLEALDAMQTLADIADRMTLANVPRHSVIARGIRIAIEGEEIVNITRHADHHIYDEPVLEVRP